MVKLYQNARELWKYMKADLAAGYAVCVQHKPEVKHFKTLEDLNTVAFPVVVETHVDYDSPSKYHTAFRILSSEEVMDRKKRLQEEMAEYNLFQEIHRLRKT